MLEDSRSLCYYNITKECTVILVLRYRAGNCHWINLRGSMLSSVLVSNICHQESFSADIDKVFNTGTTVIKDILLAIHSLSGQSLWVVTKMSNREIAARWNHSIRSMDSVIVIPGPKPKFAEMNELGRHMDNRTYRHTGSKNLIIHLKEQP